MFILLYVYDLFIIRYVYNIKCNVSFNKLRDYFAIYKVKMMNRKNILSDNDVRKLISYIKKTR